MTKTAHHIRRHRGSMLLAGAGLAALLCATAPAYAETPAAPAAAAPVAVDTTPSNPDIVVTARRIEEKLQTVPVAIAAFGATSLAERGIESQADLQIATPGLTVRETGSSDQLNYSIRGQSIDAFSFSSPAVATYFNDVPIGGAAATSFFDLGSIQVLKGPQGTLFGRNATGGAVLYATAKPEMRNSGYIKATYGSYNNAEVEGAINIALNSDWALRVAGDLHTRDGFQHNLELNTHPGSIDSKMGRISLLYAPSGSKFSNLITAQFGHFGGLVTSTKLINANGINLPSTYFDPVTNSTQPLVKNLANVYGIGGPGQNVGLPFGFTSLNDYISKLPKIGFYDFYGTQNDQRDGYSSAITDTARYDVNENLTIKNIAGYNRVSSHENSDIAASPYDFLLVGGGSTPQDQGYTFATKQWSEEIQASGNFGKLKYIVGGFIAQDKESTRIPLTVTPDLGAPYLGPYSFVTTDKSRALYAQLGYALTSKINLSGGLRGTWESVDITQDSDSLLAVVNGGIHTRKDAKPSWLAGIDYTPTEGVMVYFNQRGSWRTGGFNGTSAASFPNASTFLPETTYDFEAGMKLSGVVAGMNGHLNIAVYDQVVNNVQRAPYLNISALAGNVHRAIIKGIEIDGGLNLTQWLEVGGAFTYTDAKYTDPNASVAGANFVFGPYGDTPKTVGSGYFRLHQRLANQQGELVLRGDVYAQSTFFFGNLNNTIVPGTQLPGYALVNVRAEWNNVLGSQFSASAYVTNLGNRNYYVGGFPLGAVDGGNSVIVGTPRMYGLQLGAKF